MAPITIKVLPQKKIFLTAETTQDISEFYNIGNELDFLDRYGSRLNQEEKFFYLVENQLKFLGEFVGELKFSKIHYLLNQRNGFNFAGLNMINMLQYTTSLTGDYSREGYENTGLTQLFAAFEEDLLNGTDEISKGLIFSPPKDWAYAFAFFYEKRFDPFLNEYVVDMYPLRYAEEKNQLIQSERLLRSLPGEHQIPKSVEGYLANPLLKNVPSLNQMLELTNISANDVRQAEEFKGLMEAKLGAEIALYSRNLINLHERKSFMSDADYAREFHFLEKLRRSIFHQAKEIWQGKKEIENLQMYAEPSSTHSIIDRYAVSNSQPVIDIRRMNLYADKGPATITNGGSCPVPNTSTSNSSLMEKLESGHSIESILQTNSLGMSQVEATDEFGSLKFDCPDCNKTNTRNPHELLPACQHCGSKNVCAPR